MAVVTNLVRSLINGIFGTEQFWDRTEQNESHMATLNLNYKLKGKRISLDGLQHK